MPKVSLEDFQYWCIKADLEHLLSAKAKLMNEMTCAEKMVDAVNKAIDYRERYDMEKLKKGIDS
jgi:RNase adaptor protein for sRNA GlmZ degradation